MKKNKLSITIILLLLISSLMGISFAKNNQNEEHNNIAEKYSYQELDDDEITSILLMREEEKLARDVYLELYDKYQIKTFKNIASAEQTHMDAMLNLIVKYNLTDPIKDDTIGVFENDKLQNLYIQLLEQGSKSELDALNVGATIEDLDIFDLLESKNLTNNDDIKATYENLEKGSRNHLRAFTSKINDYSSEYENQYITKEYYNQIISTSKETGVEYGPNKEIVSTHEENGNDISENKKMQGNNGMHDGSGYKKNNSQLEKQRDNNNKNIIQKDQNTKINNNSLNIFERVWASFLSWFN